MVTRYDWHAWCWLVVVLGGVLHHQWVIWVYDFGCLLLVVIFGSSWSYLCWCSFLSLGGSPFLMCHPWSFGGGWGWEWMFMWGSSSRHPGHNCWVDCHHRVILFTNLQDADIVSSPGSHDSMFSYLRVIIVSSCFVTVVVFSSVHRKLQGCIFWPLLLLWSVPVCSGSSILSKRLSSTPHQNSISTGLHCYLALILHIIICVKSCPYGRGSSSKSCHPWPFSDVDVVIIFAFLC